MHMVGLNRDRSGFADHMPLIGQQTQGGDDGNDRHANAIFGMRGLFLRAQAHNGAPCDKYGRYGDQYDLKQRRQRLCLAMAEPVVIIGGHGGITDAEQCQQGCQNIKAGVCQRGQ